MTESTPAVERRDAAATAGSMRYWVGVAALVLLVKGVVLALDHTAMVYLGDSGSYLLTATKGYIPPDRSFVYGGVIWLLAVTTGSLTMLVAGQVVAGAGAAVCAGVIARRGFGAGPATGAMVALVCAVEPLGLMYERYIMTEAFAGLFFALMVTVGAEYLRRPTTAKVAWVQGLGVCAILFRVSFVPLVGLATVGLPLLAMRRGEGKRALRHLALAGALFLILHGGYKRVNGMLIQQALPGAGPAYNYENGLFLLTFTAPIVEPVDFPDKGKVEQVFGDLRYDVKDYRNRPKQRWLEGGLVKNVMDAYDDPLEANRVAAATAWHAVMRDPAGEARLAWRSYTDYWRPERRDPYMLADRGDRPLSPELMELLWNWFGVDGRELPVMATVTNEYFFAAWRWYLVVLLSPVIGGLAVLVTRKGMRRGAVMLWVFAGVQVVMVSVLTAEPTVRFLHGVAWLTVVIFGAMAAGIMGRRRMVRGAEGA